MKYNMTEQYARGEEKWIARFNGLNDAKNFMALKSSKNQDEGKKVIYRLYDNTDLLHQLNSTNIMTAKAEYAEGNRDFYTLTPFSCEVLLQLANTPERQSIANFNDKNDARLFVISKCNADSTISEKDLFFIYQDKSLIDTLNKIIIGNRNKKSQGSRGKEQGATFRPSPLSSRPVPPGGPADCWVENEDDNS